MTDRGIDLPDKFIDCAHPTAILGACDWFDRQGERGGVGLLIWKIKQGGVTERKAPTAPTPIRRPIFDTGALPIFYKTHIRWSQQTMNGITRDPEDCPGRLMVIEAEYPVLTVQCDTCEFEGGLPHRDLPVRIREQLGIEPTEMEMAA